MTTIASPAAGPLPFSSTVSTLPLPAALERVFGAKGTGLITLEARQGRHVVYVRDGYPVSVELPGSFELLGKVLVEMKFLDDAAYQTTLATPPPEGQRYGDILIGRGLVTEDQLRQALKAQVRRKLHRLFFLTEASITYATQEHQEGLQRNESLRIHPWRATYHGVRSAWNADRLRQALAPMAGKATRTKLTAEELARFGLGAEDGRAANLLRERALTLDALAAASGLPIQPVSALCYALLVAGALDDATPPRTASGANPAVAVPTAQPRPVSGATPIVSPTAPVRIPAFAPAAIPSAPSAAALELEKLVAKRKDTVEGEDLFAVLGLTRTATPEQIKTAYLEGARRYHPDRLAALGLTRLRDDVEKIFRRLSEAQSVLLDEGRRAAYITSLDQPKPDAAAHQAVVSALEAEMAFRRGHALLKRNDLPGALRDFQAALTAEPGEGDHVIHVAWTRRCLDQLSIAETRTEIQKGLKLSPRAASGHYFLGMLYKAEESFDAALAEFKKAVAMDARQFEAEQELRFLATRKPEKKGLFDRLRGK